MRSFSGHISLGAALLLAVALVACSTPEGELNKAKKAGTVEALDAFLQKYPEGPLADQARDAKEQLIFDHAKAANTIAAYEQFLKTYPDGRLAGAAKAGIEELHFAEAKALGTIEAWERFLTQHPRGNLVQKASKALDAMLPPTPLILSTVATSVEPYRCSAHAVVTIVHRSGKMSPDNPPQIEPLTMNCLGTIGAAGVEIERFDQRDPNHSVLNLKTYSDAGWAECGGGSCTVRFRVMGQETVFTAVYQ